MHQLALADAFDALHQEASALAGGLSDLAQRAAVYRHIFRASQRNHVFPLIAAHGALWAGGHFRKHMRIGELLSWQYLGREKLRQRRLEQLAAFRDALREVNRRVCVDTYVQFHLSQRYAQHPDLAAYIPGELLAALRMLHAACERGVALTDLARRAVFEAHFLHEQSTIVGETVARATQEFEWPLVRFLALRPRVRFAYLPAGKCLAFRNFADQQERIRNGLTAFDEAAAVGWDRVELALDDYKLLEPAFFTRPEQHFAQLAAAVLQPAIPACP